MNKIAITMGDCAGIGPEIIIKALNKIETKNNLVLIGNRKIFERNEKISNIKLPTTIEFIDIDYDTDLITNGKESKYSGELAYKCLKKACDLANSGYINKIATAPLSKNAMHLAGYKYDGQTEVLQQELSTNTTKAEMLFVANNLRIVLLTRHISIKDIPAQITRENIIKTANILNTELKSKFNINNPKIAMCALNPHAGENGILGEEEIKIINPTIEYLQENGINISGSYSADTLLGKAVQNDNLPEFDGYIACYHDQALTAIKSLGLENVLNITIGLKVLRSSPSHGTAFDIAYQNKADYRSMLNAITFLQNKSCS